MGPTHAILHNDSQRRQLTLYLALQLLAVFNAMAAGISMKSFWYRYWGFLFARNRLEAAVHAPRGRKQNRSHPS